MRAKAPSFACVLFCVSSVAVATALPAQGAPQLYTQPFHQSPVRGEPDDLLTIAGRGLVAGSVVVYRRLVDTTLPLPTPTTVPSKSTADEGVAPVVSEKALPDNVVVQLPNVMLHGESYALWARTPRGVWSAPVKINDARPLWLTPSIVPPTGSVATLPRELKVVGRNLEGSPGRLTYVTLIGPNATYTMSAADDGNDATTIERYVARVALPQSLAEGTYRVLLSRDGQSWLEVPNQPLIVNGPAQAGTVVDLAAFGCLPDDLADDRACFEAAFAYLGATGGVVHVGRGRWDLVQAADPVNGIIVPRGVSLRGDGSTLTTIHRAPTHEGQALFTLLGQNTVSGILFEDQNARTRERNVHFQLGKRPSATSPNEPREIEDVTFTGNRFREMYNAIGGGGLPVRRLYVVGNQFEAFKDAMFLDAFYLPHEPGAPTFRLEDSIIRQNLFRPGDYYDPGILQGAIATQVGASYRVDFSENVADGHAYKPPTPQMIPPGWRATFFFHQTNNHEKLLIAQNTMSCTGDKAGDGESIAFDSNLNSYAFDEPSPVISASANRVRIRGALLDTSARAFVGHWVQIVNGTGLGQSRKIVDYDATKSMEVEFIVDPPWDAVPSPGSTAVVTRQFWQTYVVDNTVDIRGCTKQNANFKKSGQFTIWAQTSDSAIEGNAQYESDGIWIFAGHGREMPAHPPYDFAPRRVHFSYFVDIRGNRIYDEYEYPTSHWSYGGSFSGIQLLHWTLSDQVAAQSGYAINIAHNTVVHADGYAGGGIAIFGAWFSESLPPSSFQYRSVLIDRNSVSNIQCVNPGCAGEVARIGIHIQDKNAHHTVLHANQVVDCNRLTLDNGFETTDVP